MKPPVPIALSASASAAAATEEEQVPSSPSDSTTFSPNHEGNIQEDHNDNDDGNESGSEFNETQDLTPEQQRAAAIADVAEAVNDWLEEAFPEEEETNNEEEEEEEEEDSSHLPILSISYIDPEVYPPSEWLPIICSKIKNISSSFSSAQTKNTKKYFHNGGTHIEITGCLIGAEGGKLLASDFLPYIAKHCKQNEPSLLLNLENNRLTPEGFLQVAESISNNSNNGGCKNCLRALNIRENQLRDDSMKYIAENILPTCPFLEELILGSNFIFPQGVETLSKGILSPSSYATSTLKVLSIEFNTLGNPGTIILCKALRECCSLIEVSLSDNSVSDEGAVAISENLLPGDCCGPLRKLDLSCNKIGLKGAKAIASVISSGNSEIECIDFGCNPSIGEEGGMILVKSIENASRLQSVDFTTCDLTAEAGNVLLNIFEKKKTLIECFIFECHQLEVETRDKIFKLMSERCKKRRENKSDPEFLESERKSNSYKKASGTNNNSNNLLTTSAIAIAAAGVLIAGGIWFWKKRKQS